MHDVTLRLVPARSGRPWRNRGAPHAPRCWPPRAMLRHSRPSRSRPASSPNPNQEVPDEDDW